MMVKVSIDSISGESTVLVNVAADTENQAKKTCMIQADEENRVGCAEHVLQLAVRKFPSAYTNSPGALLASTVVHKARRIARSFRSSPACSDSLLRIQRESSARKLLKYIIDLETRWCSLCFMRNRALCLHNVTKHALESLMFHCLTIQWLN